MNNQYIGYNVNDIARGVKVSPQYHRILHSLAASVPQQQQQNVELDTQTSYNNL